MFLNNYCYILLNYTWTSQHLDLLHYLYLYFVYRLSELNVAQYLNITCSFITVASSPSLVIVIVPSQVCMYQCYHEFNIVVLNLIWLLVLYVSPASLFISTRFFVINLDARFIHCLTNKVPFYLHIYINVSSSIIYCFFSGDICLSSGISIEFLSVFEAVSGLITLRCSTCNCYLHFL